MFQAQTALVSAITAAFVTVFIEYLAKPRLEARKDRIVEGNRERRTMMAKVLTLANDASRVGMLSQPGMAFFIGKSTLESVSEDISGLYPSLLKFEYLLGKRQRKLAAKYALGSSGKVYVLTFIALMHESTGILKMETLKNPSPTKLPMAPEIEAIWGALIEDFAAIYTVLALSRYRPWSYLRKLRQLEERQEEVDRDLRTSSVWPVDDPDGPHADQREPRSPHAP